MSIWELIEKHFGEILTIIMPIVTSIWAFVKIIYSKKYDELLSIRKKQLEDVYGYLRVLCLKYLLSV